eukprot:5949953-Prymnesium_polylepis.1
MVDARRLMAVVRQLLRAVLVRAVFRASSAPAAGAIELEASTTIGVGGHLVRARCGRGRRAEADAAAGGGVTGGGASEQAE